MLLFPALPFTREIDPVYAPEREAARALGWRTGLLDDEALRSGDTAAALKALPSGDGGRLVYRGWMLEAPLYATLHAALLKRGYQPVTTPAQYAACHHLSQTLDILGDWTPQTTFIALGSGGEVDWAAVRVALDALGPHAAIVKDDVKSRKHEWLEACFIPDASQTEEAMQVVRTFVERQGAALTGGVALRRFETFRPIGTHQQSGMPLTEEYRVFMVSHQPAVVADYWETPNAAGSPLPLDELTRLAAAVPSPFFTMDVARLASGGWRVVELGDGQVAGRPEQVSAESLVQALQPLLQP